ncbi:MAG: CubicO group peptidase (beta-lactamase class C family) [Planctomycetota bacterium]|jgi:CubicO group peptidase (beta-lactamase class C family)
MCIYRNLIPLVASLAIAIPTLAVGNPAPVAPLAAQDATTVTEAFPASTALAESVSPDSLQRLSELVQGFVDDEEIVGGELLVIKNGRTILHEGYGWNDKELGVAMGTGNVFCVRSMTKPLIGTSILMLVDDRKLKLKDPVSKYLPNWDEGWKGEITIEHLLTHTSGLSMSKIMAMDLTSLSGIQAVAALGSGSVLEFEPGTSFNYSDQGTDTLTAVIEVVSEMPAEDFVRTRVLDPLGMQDSACVMTEGHALRERGCHKYNGYRGNWTSFWDPSAPPLFSFFLGSQGLYSTLEDYGRFMEFWVEKGRSRSERLLAPRYVRKALAPSEILFPGSTGIANLEATYGFLMQLWTGEVDGGDEGEREVVAFGHSGSDGTHAWAFPDQDAIVLYFTQSRGTTTGLRVEEALGELFLGVAFDPNQAAPPLEQYLGYYAEDERSRYQAVIMDGDSLALETPGRRIRQLIYAGEDNWKYRAKPSVVLVFDRNEEGDVSGFHIDDHYEYRFEAASDLPSAAEVSERVTKTHRLDLLESIGPIRMESTLRIEKLDIDGDVTTLIRWPNQFRIDSTARDQIEQVAYDGDKVWYSSTAQELMEMEGERAQQMREENTFAVFGDWLAWCPELQVIQHIEEGTQDIMILRAGDTSAPATTLYVDWSTGQVRRMDRVTVIEGMGRIGQATQFSDFRDVSGVLLPFESSTEIANAMIGSIVTKIVSFELGVDVPEGAFDLTD